MAAVLLDQSARIRDEWMPDLHQALGQYMRQVMMKRQFESGGTYLGDGWVPNAGGYADWKIGAVGHADPGILSGAMMRAFTGEPEPFSMASPVFFSDPVEMTTVTGEPVLEYDADHVTVGGAVYSGGVEYAEAYDFGWGPIFGNQELPADVMQEAGKLLSLGHKASVAHTFGMMEDEFGKKVINRDDLRWTYDAFPDRNFTRWIENAALIDVMASA